MYVVRLRAKFPPTFGKVAIGAGTKLRTLGGRGCGHAPDSPLVGLLGLGALRGLPVVAHTK